MPDLADGESTSMQGSGAKPYELKIVGGVYSCSCPAWRNQSLGIEISIGTGLPDLERLKPDAKGLLTNESYGELEALLAQFA